MFLIQKYIQILLILNFRLFPSFKESINSFIQPIQRLTIFNNLNLPPINLRSIPNLLHLHHLPPLHLLPPPAINLLLQYLSLSKQLIKNMPIISFFIIGWYLRMEHLLKVFILFLFYMFVFSLFCLLDL